MSPIVPNVVVRTDSLSEYKRVGHGIVNPQGEAVPLAVAVRIISSNFRLTTFRRFKCKVGKIMGFQQLMREVDRTYPGTAWHWHYWADIFFKSEDALKQNLVCSSFFVKDYRS